MGWEKSLECRCQNMHLKKQASTYSKRYSGVDFSIHNIILGLPFKNLEWLSKRWLQSEWLSRIACENIYRSPKVLACMHSLESECYTLSPSQLYLFLIPSACWLDVNASKLENEITKIIFCTLGSTDHIRSMKAVANCDHSHQRVRCTWGLPDPLRSRPLRKTRADAAWHSCWPSCRVLLLLQPPWFCHHDNRVVA